MQSTANATSTSKAQATRQQLLDAAVSSLIECGVSRTTTLEVQRRSGASRGALLHHFPTHAALLSATIAELVRRNDEAVRQAESTMAHVTYLAELELWGAARTDSDLQEAVRSAERDARLERERVVDSLFAPVLDNPNYPAVKALSIAFLRGMSLSSVLVSNLEHSQKLVSQWVWAVEALLQAPSQS